MALDPFKLRAAGLPQEIIKLLIETQGVVSRISSMAATVKQHLFFTESHAKTAAAARNETVGLKGQIEASAQAIAGDRAAIAQTAARVATLEAGTGQITGLRIVGNKLILDRKNAASLEVTMPTSGGGTQVAPSFAVRPSLTGSTALGGTVAVDFGVAAGTPAPSLTGTLTRPGKAPAAVLDGATFQIEAADQGGTITLDVTAANSAGSVTASAALAVPAAGPPTVHNVTDGGYSGATPTVTTDGTVTLALATTPLTQTHGVRHFLCRVDKMTGKTLKLRRPVDSISVGQGDLSVWQAAWAYDKDGDWFPFDSVTIQTNTVIAANSAPAAQETVYVGWRPVFTNARWDAAIARWRASPHTSPTASGDANFIVGVLPANAYAPTMNVYGFKIGAGPEAVSVTGNVHVDEHAGAHAYEGLVDWLLGNDPAAVRLRAAYTFYCYPKLNPQARYAGASRTEVTSGEDANRIWETTGKDSIPLSKMMRDIWQADLPSRLAAVLDFHDYPGATWWGQAYFYRETDLFEQLITARYLARTGHAIERGPGAVVGGVTNYLATRFNAAMGLTVEHGTPVATDAAEWRRWGEDWGRTLDEYSQYYQPADWTWLPRTASTTLTTNGAAVTAATATAADPGMSFAIPEGATIDVWLEVTALSNIGDIFLRHSEVQGLLSAQSDNIKQVTGLGKHYITARVTWAANRSYLGLIAWRPTQTAGGSIRIDRARYRVIE